jgi:aminopeptidase-like protein
MTPANEALARELLELIRALHPICRSITGDGVRATLRLVGERVPLQLHEVASGAPVLDWTVPDEWNVRDAWIKNARGERVVDFRRHNLHLVSYSEPVAPRTISRQELSDHLYALPAHPDWIPYRTSYYKRSWGFCVSQKQLESLSDPEYEVCVDTTLAPGHLSYGEAFLPGEREDEIVFSAHVCHPSLADDNLSGIAVASAVARALAARPRRRFSYRFLFIPGTIGSLTWLARNRDRVGKIKGGLTLVCLGDERGFTYKRSFAGNALIDRAAERVLARSGRAHEVIDFFPYGYDERQFNSPGFRIPIGSLMRGRHGRFDEYHTSADDLSFVRGESLVGAVESVLAIADVLEGDTRFQSLAPYGEPQLGRRGLYRAMGGESDPEALQLAMLWVLSLADGEHSLADAAERSGIRLDVVRAAATLLERHELIRECD